MVNDAIYSDGLPYMRAMGDALLAAQEIGAGLSDMSFVSFTPVRFGTHYYSLSLEAIGGAEGISRVTGLPVGPRRQGFQRIVLVKGDGTRYVNEAEATHRNPRLIRDTNGVPPAEYPEEPFIAKFLALGNPKNVWAVTDAVSAGEMRWPVDQIVSPNPRRGRGLHPDSVAHADNLEELAEKIGMPIERFMETMTRYNEFAKAGIDADLGKPAPLFEIVEAPFYAAKMNIIRHTPPGGLRINSKGQVLDRAQLFDGMTSVGVDEEQVIPGLYAAGECAAFVGFRRSHRKTGPIITMGRIAGISAAGSS
jgi:succinate dehydrogenase/fumarate reductase flavoprotein subunit